MRTSSSVILALALLAGGVTSFNAPVRTVRLATSPSWLARPQTLPRLHAEGDDAEAPAEPDFEAAAASTATGEKTPIDAIEVNSEVEGTVKGVSDFGAFVDFGAVTDGLVHKSQLSDDFVDNPADVVQIGQKVTVRVIRVDAEKNQVSLSMKSKAAGKSGNRRDRSSPDLKKYEAMEEQVVLSGTVKTIAAYGAFVELEGGVTGLVHISQLTEGRVDNVESAVSVGDAVKVRVLSVSDGKLSLTMKEYKESAPKADFKPRDRGNRNARIDDIWSDSTEPEWQKYLEEATEGFDNVLELKL